MEGMKPPTVPVEPQAASSTGGDPSAVYRMVTEQVLDALSQGVAPWRRPWTQAEAPRNIDGRPYRGINVFLLTLVAHSRGYRSPFWLTFNQAKAKGGAVSKGAKSTIVTFWKRLTVEDQETGETKTVPLLRYFRVFNLEQCDGVQLPKAVIEAQARIEADARRTFCPIEAARILIDNMPARPRISHDRDRAYYSPALDLVNLPRPESFDAPEHYYGTAFHELGHSTGHPSRLNRPTVTDADASFGSAKYGREELIAEMTAAFLCAEAGILTMPVLTNSAAYVDNWRRAIKEDVRAVVVAAGAAQRAADWIAGRGQAEGAPDRAT